MFKKFVSLLSVLALTVVLVFGQQNDAVLTEKQDNYQSLDDFPTKSKWRDENSAINVGFLMGGGGLIGADLEFLILKRFGLQVGGGLGSMGFGINYHFKPYINSQFVSVVYWHQGFGDNHYSSYLGPMYGLRAKKIFQFSIGIGTILTKGPGWDKAWKNKNNEPTGNVALLFNIGVFFPL